MKMEASDSGGSQQQAVVEPTQKKRKSAEEAEVNIHEFGQFSSGGGEGNVEKGPFYNDVPSRKRKNSEDPCGGGGDTPPSQRGRVKDDGDGGASGGGQEREDDDYYDDDGDEESDDFPDEEFETENDDDYGAQAEGNPGTCSSEGRRYASRDFSPPSFLRTVLAKRQKNVDDIRRQLPTDSRSNQQKLIDWYNMLSKLDRPVALLSLISPPHPSHQ